MLPLVKKYSDACYQPAVILKIVPDETILDIFRRKQQKNIRNTEYVKSSEVFTSEPVEKTISRDVISSRSGRKIKPAIKYLDSIDMEAFKRSKQSKKVTNKRSKVSKVPTSSESIEISKYGKMSSEEKTISILNGTNFNASSSDMPNKNYENDEFKVSKYSNQSVVKSNKKQVSKCSKSTKKSKKNPDICIKKEFIQSQSNDNAKEVISNLEVKSDIVSKNMSNKGVVKSNKRQVSIGSKQLSIKKSKKNPDICIRKELIQSQSNDKTKEIVSNQEVKSDIIAKIMTNKGEIKLKLLGYHLCIPTGKNKIQIQDLINYGKDGNKVATHSIPDINETLKSKINSQICIKPEPVVYSGTTPSSSGVKPKENYGNEKRVLRHSKSNINKPKKISDIFNTKYVEHKSSDVKEAVLNIEKSNDMCSEGILSCNNFKSKEDDYKISKKIVNKNICIATETVKVNAVKETVEVNAVEETVLYPEVNHLAILLSGIELSEGILHCNNFKSEKNDYKISTESENETVAVNAIEETVLYPKVNLSVLSSGIELPEGTTPSSGGVKPKANYGNDKRVLRHSKSILSCNNFKSKENDYKISTESENETVAINAIEETVLYPEVNLTILSSTIELSEDIPSCSYIKSYANYGNNDKNVSENNTISGFNKLENKSSDIFAVKDLQSADAMLNLEVNQAIMLNGCMSTDGIPSNSDKKPTNEDYEFIHKLKNKVLDICIPKELAKSKFIDITNQSLANIEVNSTTTSNEITSLGISSSSFVKLNANHENNDKIVSKHNNIFKTLKKKMDSSDVSIPKEFVESHSVGRVSNLEVLANICNSEVYLEGIPSSIDGKDNEKKRSNHSSNYTHKLKRNGSCNAKLLDESQSIDLTNDEPMDNIQVTLPIKSNGVPSSRSDGNYYEHTYQKKLQHSKDNINKLKMDDSENYIAKKSIDDVNNLTTVSNELFSEGQKLSLNVRKHKFFKSEFDFLTNITELRNSLQIDKTDLPMAINALENMNKSVIDVITLKKYPTIVDIIQKVSVFVGVIKKPNTKSEQKEIEIIRKLAIQLLRKLESLFTVPDKQTFQEAFNNDIRKFQYKVRHLTDNEIFVLMADPYENDK